MSRPGIARWLLLGALAAPAIALPGPAIVLAAPAATPAPSAAPAQRPRPPRVPGVLPVPLPPPPPPPRPSGPPVRRAERTALQTFLGTSPRPPGASDLQRFGKRPDRLLISLAEDGEIDPLLRARAISALAHTHTAEARGFLERVLAEKRASADDNDRLLLRRAAVALGWHGGSNSAAVIGPLLDHQDAEVRVDAAVALGLSRLPEAMSLLRTRLPREPDARVRGHLARQLQSLEAAPGAPAAPPRPPAPASPPPSVGSGSRSGF